MTQPTGPPGPDDPTRPSPWADPATGPARPPGTDGRPPGAPTWGPPATGPVHPGPPGPPTSPPGAAAWGAPGSSAGGPPGAPPGSPAAGGPGGAASDPGADGAGGSSPRARRGPLRILGRALVVLVVLGALAGTTAWGFANRSSAERWRDRSEAADARLTDSLDEVETTRDEVDDAEQRLRDLAAEKAGETDRNRILSDIVAQAPEVTAALRECQQETTTLTNDIIGSVGDPAADVADIQRRISVVNGLCEDALSAATGLEDSIDELDI